MASQSWARLRDFHYEGRRASQVAPVVKNLPASVGDARDMGSIPGLGRSPGVGNGNPFRILAWKIPRAQEPGYSPWSCKQSDMIE